jgi:hypothetical protein
LFTYNQTAFIGSILRIKTFSKKDCLHSSNQPLAPGAFVNLRVATLYHGSESADRVHDTRSYRELNDVGGTEMEIYPQNPRDNDDEVVKSEPAEADD